MTVSSPGGRNVTAEKRALRRRMRMQGLGIDQVAAELARRYGYRPRKAWREARGLSTIEAAAAINDYLAEAGLDPEGRGPWTAPRLWEYETFPGGDGCASACRKPTLMALTLMAAVYGTTPAALIDTADRDHLTPVDLYLIDGGAGRRARDPHLPATARPQPAGAPGAPGGTGPREGRRSPRA